MCTDYRLTEAQRTSHAELQWDSTQRWSSHYSDSHSSYLTTNHSAAVTPTAATIYTPLIIYLVLQAAENMSNTLIHLYLYFWPLKVQYVRLWSFWHHCTVLLMFFNDSVLSRLLFQCTDVVFRWVFSLVRHSSSPGGACELSMNPGRILSSRHPPSQSHNRPVRLISPLTP